MAQESSVDTLYKYSEPSIVVTGWQRHWDEARDVPFYVSEATGETRWSLDGLAAPSVADSGTSSLEAERVHLTVPSQQTGSQTASGAQNVSQPPQQTRFSSRAACGVVSVVLITIAFALWVQPVDRTECSFAGREDSCPVHVLSSFVVLAVLTGSILNVTWYRPLHPRSIVAAVSLLLLLSVLYSVITVETPATAERVSVPSLDFGDCTFVDEESHIVSPDGADYSQLDSVMALCEIRNQYVHVPQLWMNSAGRVSKPVRTCTPSFRTSVPSSAVGGFVQERGSVEGQFTLYDRVSEAIPSWFIEIASAIGVVASALEGEGERIWPNDWKIMSPQQRVEIAKSGEDGFLTLACQATIVPCTSTCEIVPYIPQEACERIRDDMTSPVSGEAARLNVIFDVFGPVCRSTRDPCPDPSVRNAIEAIGLDPSAVFSFMFAAMLCVNDPASVREFPGAGQMDCLASDATANAGDVTVSASSWEWAANSSLLNVTFRTFPGGNSSEIDTSGNCFPANRKLLLAAQQALEAAAAQNSQSEYRSSYWPLEQYSALSVVLLLPFALLCDDLLRATCGKRCLAPESVADSERQRRRAATSLQSWWLAMGWEGLFFCIVLTLLAAVTIWVGIQQSQWLLALLFHSVAWMCIVLMLYYPFWWTHDVWEDTPGLFTRLRTWLGVQRFAYGQPYHFVFLLFMEIVEITTQVANLLTLSSTTGVVAYLSLVTILSLNLMSTPLLVLFVSDKWLAVAMYGTDMFFDSAYLLVSVVIRDTSDMSAGTAVLLLVPLVAQLTRSRTILRNLVGLRFRILVQSQAASERNSSREPERNAIEMSRRVSVATVLRNATGLALPDLAEERSVTDVQSVLPKTAWQPRKSLTRALSAVGVVCASLLLLSTTIRIVQQDQACRAIVGDAIWDAIDERLFFSGGLLRSTDCGFQFVTSLEVHSEQVSSETWDVVANTLDQLETVNMSSCVIDRLSASTLRLSRLRSLDVSYNRISVVDSDIFDLPNLLLLSLDGNPFASHVQLVGVKALSPLLLSSISTSVTRLDVRNSSLTEVPLREIAGMPRLSVFDASFSSTLANWPSVGASTILLPSTLRVLNFSFTGLATMEGIVISSFREGHSELVTLDISYTKITIARAAMVVFKGTLLMEGLSVVPVFPKLFIDHLNPEVIRRARFLDGVFDISQSRILTSELDTVDDLLATKNISTAVLWSCQLTRVPEFIRNSTSVHTLDMLGNVVQSWTPHAFAVPGISSPLRALSCGSVPVTAIAAGTFLGLDKLWFLSIANIIEAAVYNDSLKGLSSLTHLSISDTIGTIEAGAFVHTPLLQQASLSLSRFSGGVPAGLFSPLTSLSCLNLNGCLLRELKNDTFKTLWNLTRLDLGSNPLTSIEAGTFLPLTNLRFLNLVDTPVTYADLLPLLPAVVRNRLSTNIVNGTVVATNDHQMDVKRDTLTEEEMQCAARRDWAGVDPVRN